MQWAKIVGENIRRQRLARYVPRRIGRRSRHCHASFGKNWARWG